MGKKKRNKAVKPIVDVDEYKCSNCGHTLEKQVLLSPNILLHEFYEICPGCGRKVKWE